MNNTNQQEKNAEILADLASGGCIPENALVAFWEVMGRAGETPDTETLQAAEDCFIGEFDSLTHLAEHLSDEMGMLDQMPENLRYYFDFEKYGRDLQLGGDVWEEGGFYFWNR